MQYGDRMLTVKNMTVTLQGQVVSRLTPASDLLLSVTECADETMRAINSYG